MREIRHEGKWGIKIKLKKIIDVLCWTREIIEGYLTRKMHINARNFM